MRRSLLAAAVLALSLALLLPVTGRSAPAAGTSAKAAEAAKAKKRTRTVRVGDNWFVRRRGTPTIRVRRGTRVRFRWVGRAPHNVTVVSGPRRFRSSTKTRGTFTRRLTRRGTYRIVCTIHGARDQSMRIRVR